MKKAIEQALPLKTLNKSAINEKVHKGHPGNMHLWWNRSPIDSSSALLYAAIKDALPEEHEQYSSEISRIALTGATQIVDTENLPVVVDPFSGFGGLVMAAQRLGLKIQSGDLNAVATLLAKAAAEIPSRFANCRAVHPEAENKLYFGLQGLASDVHYYGNLLKTRAQNILDESYPSTDVLNGSENTPTYAWVWVRTVKCPNPACGCQMPLATSYVLSKLKGREYWAEPVLNGKTYNFKIHQGICPKDKETNKHGSHGSRFQCPACGTLTTDAYMKKEGKEHGLGLQLMAICATTKNSKLFVEPNEIHINAAKVALPKDLPIGSLPKNTRWFSPPEFGLTDYSSLYTPRQLLLMTTFCDLLAEVQNKVVADAILAGMSKDDTPLKNDGTGALAYAQAICVYLTLAIDKMANFQSTMCSLDNRQANIRATFTRQAIPMTWVFAEGNPFSTVTGNFATMLKNVVESVEQLPFDCHADVHQADAITWQYPDNSILFTELPYYDHIGYADLSDYFYIWMRRCLKEIYPKLFEKVVTSKEELTSIAEHFDGDSAASVALQNYRNGIEQLCNNFYSAASKQYPSIIFFEYRDIDEQIIKAKDEVVALSPLEHLLYSIINAGFMVTNIWPIRIRESIKCGEATRIAVVFKKKSENVQHTTRRGFINALMRELPDNLDLMFSDEVDDCDKQIAGIGGGLSVFTRYTKVINADGSNMQIHDALQIIYQEVKNYIDMHNQEELAGED